MERGAECEAVLRALPEWFGIEAAIVHYVEEISTLPTWVARQDDAVVGFLSVKQHFGTTAELYVMGVLPAFHRAGIGRQLLEQAEASLREQGVALFFVKTLAASHPSQEYARTRAFYEAQGFHPLEAIPEIWGPQNPCLLMAKAL